MRIGNISAAVCLASLISSFFPLKADSLGGIDAVAVQYYFAGATDLSGNTNFNQAKTILTTVPAGHFQDLVLNRLAMAFADKLQFDPGANTAALLQPLLYDLLHSESMGSFGGHDPNRMDFVVAARLDAKSTAGWQTNLEIALHGKGEPLTEQGFSGRRWNRPGNNAIWMLRARDWTVVGRGEDMLPVRNKYLQHIAQGNRPAPLNKDSWLNVAVDWPLLATWAPLPHCPLKLARVVLDMSAQNGRMRATAAVSYPEAVPWEAQPWRIPKGLVYSPLSSFTATRNLAPYLNSNEIWSRLSSNPLSGQLFCWALRAMPLLNYAAWPVTDATNAVRKLGTEAPAALNPLLQARDHTQLNWSPKKDQVQWLHLPLTGPILEAAHDQSGDFLLADLFPMDVKHVPPPEQLWNQFETHNDVLYYDWELTGLRVRQWRLLTELLPILPPETPAASNQKTAPNARSSIFDKPQIRLAITKAWLESLTALMPPANTVTEVTRTSATELKVVRNSQFLCTGLELVLLSHWLADAPVGPIDDSLLPRAKMSGPGLPTPKPAVKPAMKPPANLPSKSSSP